MQNKKKIVILGGGFAGLYAYRSIIKHCKQSNIEVTIINRTNYFVFTPLLHEVASGSLAHHNVVESIREVIHRSNGNLVVADIDQIETKNKIVKTSSGNVPYDILIIALGATTNFFNVPGAREHSLVLKDLSDAIAMRSKFIDTFEEASLIKDEAERRKKLSFAVVGGGATGVELVSDIAELFFKTFSKYYKGFIHKEDVTLSLINKGSDVLPYFPQVLRKKALSVLQSYNIDVILNKSVQKIDKDHIYFGDGSQLPAHVVIWTGGVRPNTPSFDVPIELDSAGRILTDRYLQVKGAEDTFAIGDVAGIEGMPLPMLAQISVKQGKYLGRTMARIFNKGKRKEFKYRSSGALASLGRYQAVAHIGPFNFSGFFAWFLWRTIYLFKFLSLSKKIKIAVDWTINLFYPRDITKS